jgi:hypothetical protein
MSSPTTETSPKENSQKIGKWYYLCYLLIFVISIYLGSGYSLRDKRKVTRRDDEFEYENPRSRITPLRKRKSFGDRKPPSGRRRPRNTQRLQSTTKTNPVKTALVEQHKKPEKHPNAKKVHF